jgi:hypothetical protein
VDSAPGDRPVPKFRVAVERASDDSPARLYQLAKDDGRIVAKPYPGVMVFIDLTGQNFANGYISRVGHRGIGEWRQDRDHSGITGVVAGSAGRLLAEYRSVICNGNPDPSVVTLTTYEIGDGYVIAFASFSKGDQ